MQKLIISNLGRTRYADAWKLQKQLFHDHLEKATTDMLLLTEHDHVYTLGKGSDRNHLLAGGEELQENGIDVFEIDRGGDVTYHGPGQLVGYPILDLQQHYRDIHRYLRDLEEILIRTVHEFGFPANRCDGYTGVWVGDEKIAAIGVKVSRWITMHGFALNVNTDLRLFDRIIPCGIFHKGVTSLQKLTGSAIPMTEVHHRLIKNFADVFDYQPEWRNVSQIKHAEQTEDVKVLQGNVL